MGICKRVVTTVHKYGRRNRHNRRVSSTETPGGSGIPAGWYDDPSGEGLRWWDGEQWTEHVHTAESAAAATGATGSESGREGKPPRDLVKLRESIRGRGAKGVGIVLGAVVLVIVVVALLVSGGSENSNGAANPGATPPAATTGTGSSTQAQIKKIDKQLKSKKLSKSQKKKLEAKKKKLEKGTGKSAKGAKQPTPGEAGN
jgi:hypothetical protein